MQTNIEIEINILVDSKTVSSLAPMLGEVYIKGYKQVLITGHVKDLSPSNWGRDLVNFAFAFWQCFTARTLAPEESTASLKA